MDSFLKPKVYIYSWYYCESLDDIFIAYSNENYSKFTYSKSIIKNYEIY